MIVSIRSQRLITVPNFSYLTSVKFQRLSKLTNDLATKEDQEKTSSSYLLKEKPYIWSKCASFVCEIDGNNIVKKLDINQLVKQKYIKRNGEQYLKLSGPNVTQFLRQPSVTCNCYEDTNLDKQKLDVKYIPVKHFDLIKYSRNCDREELSNVKLLYNKQTKNNFSNHNDNSTKNELPTTEQLDGMMLYFAEEAQYLFKKQGWSYKNCSYQIVFENNILRTRTESLNAYIFQVNFMKNFTKLILSNPHLTIIRMSKNPQDGSIHIRWQVEGIPHYLQPLSWFGIVDEKRVIRYIDGYSIFFVKCDGLYHKHILMNLTPLRNEKRTKLFSQVLARLGYGIYPKQQPVLPTFQEQRMK